MSYCVNCGVELSDTEKNCPLCFVEVQNPKKPFDPNTPRRFSDIPIRGIRAHHRDLVLPIALLMLIPMIICFVCDYLPTGSFDWSGYVAATLILLATFILPPMAMRLTREKILLCFFLDWLVTICFMYMLNSMTDGGWFLPSAFPIVLISGSIVILLAAIFSYIPLRKLVRSALILDAVGLISLVIDFFIKRHIGFTRFPVNWSLFVFIPCLILSIVFFIINRNKKLKEQFRQRFFV